MTQKPTPRDSHADNELIDNIESVPVAQSGRSGGRAAEEIANRVEEKSALGADPAPTRDWVQPAMPERSDHGGAVTVGSNFDRGSQPMDRENGNVAPRSARATRR